MNIPLENIDGQYIKNSHTKPAYKKKLYKWAIT